MKTIHVSLSYMSKKCQNTCDKMDPMHVKALFQESFNFATFHIINGENSPIEIVKSKDLSDLTLGLVILQNQEVTSIRTSIQHPIEIQVPTFTLFVCIISFKCCYYSLTATSTWTEIAGSRCQRLRFRGLSLGKSVSKTLHLQKMICSWFVRK